MPSQRDEIVCGYAQTALTTELRRARRSLASPKADAGWPSPRIGGSEGARRQWEITAPGVPELWVGAEKRTTGPSGRSQDFTT